MEFREKLALMRTRKKMSQGDLAVSVGLHQSRISKWESGEGEPSLSQAAKLAAALEVSMEYLADDAADEPESVDPDLRLLLENARRIGYGQALDRVLNPSGIEPMYPFKRNPGGKT